MLNRKRYLEDMRELLYMRRRTYKLLEKLNDFSDEEYSEIEQNVDGIYEYLETGERLLRPMSSYWLKSNNKNSSEEELEEEYSVFVANRTRAFLAIQDAVDIAEDIVFDPERIEGLTKKQRQLLKKDFAERINYINDKKDLVYRTLIKKACEGFEIARMLKEFFGYEDKFNQNLNDYNSHYVEREKYDEMFLVMDSNMAKLTKGLKRIDDEKKGTLK